jgi:hypothetical protein
MPRLPSGASTTLISALVMTVACAAPAGAGAYRVWPVQACGPGLDFCTQACDDYGAAGGPYPGRCNDHCLRRAGVCEASRIPAPAGHHTHARSAIARR